MNFELWLILASVLIIVELSPYSHTRLYLAASALVVMLFQLVCPATPVLCLMGLWLALAAVLGYAWIRKGDCCIAMLQQVLPKLTAPTQATPIVSGGDLIGEFAEITAIYRDGFIDAKLQDRHKSTLEWKGRDSKSFDKHYAPLKIGQKVKIIDYKDLHIIVEAV